MSMWRKPSYAIPTTTAQVAHAAFPNGCLAIRIRDTLGELCSPARSSPACSSPSCTPAGVAQRSPRARLALVLVLQFVEGLTDRQAADAVRARLDWKLDCKYALGLDLDDPGFDASVLTEFRTQLLADGQTE